MTDIHQNKIESEKKSKTNIKSVRTYWQINDFLWNNVGKLFYYDFQLSFLLKQHQKLNLFLDSKECFCSEHIVLIKIFFQNIDRKSEVWSATECSN